MTSVSAEIKAPSPEEKLPGCVAMVARADAAVATSTFTLGLDRDVQVAPCV